MKTENKKILINVGIAVGAYYFVLRPILTELGVIKTASSSASTTNPVYNPNLPNANYSTSISVSDAKNIASEIHSAFNYFGIGAFNYILNAIKKCGTKGDVNIVAQSFSNQYGLDMYSFMQNGGGIFPWDGLSSSEMQQVNDYVNSLPS